MQAGKSIRSIVGRILTLPPRGRVLPFGSAPVPGRSDVRPDEGGLWNRGAAPPRNLLRPGTGAVRERSPRGSMGAVSRCARCVPEWRTAGGSAPDRPTSRRAAAPPAGRALEPPMPSRPSWRLRPVAPFWCLLWRLGRGMEGRGMLVPRVHSSALHSLAPASPREPSAAGRDVRPRASGQLGPANGLVRTPGAGRPYLE